MNLPLRVLPPNLAHHVSTDPVSFRSGLDDAGRQRRQQFGDDHAFVLEVKKLPDEAYDVRLELHERTASEWVAGAGRRGGG